MHENSCTRRVERKEPIVDASIASNQCGSHSCWRSNSYQSVLASEGYKSNSFRIEVA